MSTGANGVGNAATLTADELREFHTLAEAARSSQFDTASVEALEAFHSRHPQEHRAVFRGQNKSRSDVLSLVLPSVILRLDGRAYRDIAAEEEAALAGPHPSAIVKALAQQAATEGMWLKAAFAAVGPTATENRLRFLMELSDQVQKRYLRTLKMLAVVRRLERGMDIRVTHTLEAPATAPRTKTVQSTVRPSSDLPSLPEASPSLISSPACHPTASREPADEPERTHPFHQSTDFGNRDAEGA